ncbi:hybrid sensor histidine kinase/response regulator [Sulfurimonas sp.]|uniref:response regulator n=1 Tax=Sulfurimonas sp. TaxID=2022749 RepID=UPI0025EE0888|nr:hybrid sensor histidine kinase/response regulator [Sulfurimonas sp.]
MGFINNFFTEIVAVVIVVTIYVVTKKSKSNSEITQNETAEESDNKTNKIQSVVAEEKIVPQKKIDAPKIAIDRKKRALLPHEKITKDDFSIFKNIRILVAEDNVINQKVLTGILGGSGMDIVIANDGQEALDMLENDTNFALILMDAHMPVLDGFQATRLIRQNPKYEHIPVIALSGDTAADDIRNMLNAGMEAHLEKPIRMDSLYDVLFVYSSGNESKLAQDSDLEFDSEKGLEISGNDKDFYIEILDEFILKYSDSASEIQRLLATANSAGADKLLLDISGIAANIGADNLYGITITLKQSIINPTDLEYITNLKNYQRALIKVCDAIKEYKLNA